MMETPFPKSISFAKKYSLLLDIVKPSDTLGILINADPDSMASAMALKRVFKNLVVILRNASFHGDAGKTARKIFARWKGSAGGHQNAARAEIPLENILDDPADEPGLGTLVKKILKDMK
jgi:nanoRNase/pAp phosphatase (c-di-AMP/oligoRNAs hydrolase)